jgi:hypothetical protein
MKRPAASNLRQARVATRWVAASDPCASAFHVGHAPIAESMLHAAERENARRRAELLALLQGSRARNHWRVALRRYLMLRECGYDVPADIAAYCEPLVCRMADSELGRAREAVRMWVAMTSRRALPW